MTIPCGNTQAEMDNDRPAAHGKDSDDYDRADYVDIDDIRYGYIVYQNTVAGLLAGAALHDRLGSKLYSLDQINTDGMTAAQIDLEARVMASYIVG